MDGKGELSNTAKENERVKLNHVKTPKPARIRKYWVVKAFSLRTCQPAQLSPVMPVQEF